MSEAGAPSEPIDGPALTVAAVARRLGVAPATLRTWDRRYGLGPSEHSAGAHRRYTPADVQRLDLMRRLTRDGVLPAEAARVVLSGAAPPPPPAQPPGPDGLGGSAGQRPRAETAAAVRGIVRAAQALDAESIETTVTRSLQSHGVLWTWDQLLVPALRTIGDRWGATGTGVDVEHLLAESILCAFRALQPRAPANQNARPVLLACSPEEQHTLPLHAIAAALHERAIDARVLGARVPPDALAAAVRRAGASAVFIWAHDPAIADQDQLAVLPPMRPPVTLVVGGPGWASSGGDGVTRVHHLGEAVTVLQRAAIG